MKKSLFRNKNIKNSQNYIVDQRVKKNTINQIKIDFFYHEFGKDSSSFRSGLVLSFFISSILFIFINFIIKYFGFLFVMFLIFAILLIIFTMYSSLIKAKNKKYKLVLEKDLTNLKYTERVLLFFGFYKVVNFIKDFKFILLLVLISIIVLIKVGFSILVIIHSIFVILFIFLILFLLYFYIKNQIKYGYSYSIKKSKNIIKGLDFNFIISVILILFLFIFIIFPIFYFTENKTIILYYLSIMIFVIFIFHKGISSLEKFIVKFFMKKYLNKLRYYYYLDLEKKNSMKILYSYIDNYKK